MNDNLNTQPWEIIHGDALKLLKDFPSGSFDAVITNPPIRTGKQVIYKMFSDAQERLVEGGELYIVIRKQQGAESAKKYLQTLFEDVSVIDKSGGFWIIRCVKGGAVNS